MSGFTAGRRAGMDAAGRRYDELMRYYSAALDEVFRLRRALAYEAGVIEAHLTLKSFPASRRPIAEVQVDRARLAARGLSARAYAGIRGWTLSSAMADAQASNGLTVAQWEREVNGS